MVTKRNRIIYASQSVHAEGQVLYRVQSFASSTTFNTEDLFELGQLELTDVVDDSPEVSVTIDTNDYGSIYTMATLAKVPLNNLNHNIRQSDGTTFNGTVSGVDLSLGDIDSTTASGAPVASGTGIANIVVRDGLGGQPLRYFHGVQLIDFARECGFSKGVDIYSPVQEECSLGSASADIATTKYLSDVFINSIELSYQSDDIATENYEGETEQKFWLFNSGRYVTWEEWEVGFNADEIDASAMGSKTELQLSLPIVNTVATRDNGNLAFLKTNEVGRPSALMTFSRGGGLTIGESKFIPIFDGSECIPSNAIEYFVYDSANNTLDYFANGIATSLINALPAGRSTYQSGDKVTVVYGADAYGAENPADRPAGADATRVTGKYFAPVPTRDVEDVGGLRQGQLEAYLVDPDLVLNSALTSSTIGATTIDFSGNIDSSVDLTRFVGLPFRITSGPGAGGPAREIISATNNISGGFNDGQITLGGTGWSSIRLSESLAQASTTTEIFVDDLCSVDANYIGSDLTAIVASTPETVTITGINLTNSSILVDPLSAAPDDGSVVEVSVEPTTDSEFIVGDYELALRLTNVTFSADLTREALKELGKLNPYARPVTLPIEFTVSIETTASDLSTFATFAGKRNAFEQGTLTDLNITDLFAKDNLAIVVKVFQQNDTEAGGTGSDRRVNAPDMFGDEFFNNGIKGQYTATDGSLQEYALKTVVAQNLRITDEEYNLTLGENATQTFSFRGTNQLSKIKGDVGIEFVTKRIESQGE